MEDIEEDIEEDIHVKSNGGKEQNYILFATNKTGMLIRRDLQPSNRITDRICTTKSQLKEHKLHLISVYAHTLQKSEKTHRNT